MIKILLNLGIVILASFSSIASADITNPYTVDEKPQVLFGDSTIVPPYFGLENYILNYINNYARISFTYTHHDCCFATYPPRFYITSSDPRATSSPGVKYSANIFSLEDRFHNPLHSTDWYSYEIQFNDKGYNAVVKKAGTVEIANTNIEIPNFRDTDWVAIANLHPNVSNNSMAFTPVPVKQNLPPITLARQQLVN